MNGDCQTLPLYQGSGWPFVLLSTAAPPQAPGLPIYRRYRTLLLSGWNTWRDWVNTDSNTTGYLLSLGVPNIRPSLDTGTAAATTPSPSPIDSKDPNKCASASDYSEPGYYASDARAYVTALGSYECNATIVNHQINMVLLRYGVSKVNVVTHSMGGLDAVYALHLQDPSRVAHLIMLAVPFSGTVLADDIQTLLETLGHSYPDGLPEITTQHWKDQHGLLSQPGSVQYYTAAGTDSSKGDVVPQLLDQYEFGSKPNDQVVPVVSVNAAPGQSLSTSGFYRSHNSITGNKSDTTGNKDDAVFDAACPYLALSNLGCHTQSSTDSTTTGIASTANSTSASSDSSSTRNATQMSTPSIVEGAIQRGPLVVATIASGASVTETVPVASSTDLDLLLTGNQAGLQMTLSDPSGQAITPMSAGVQYTQTLTDGGGDAINYDLSNPSPGTWTAVITNTDQQHATAILLRPSMMSTLMLTPMGAPIARLGATTPFSATLSDAGAPVTGATITATASLHGSTPVTVTLADIGNGVYKGDFGALSTPGHYTVNLIATGTDNSLPFALTSLAFFTIAAGNASFTGSYAEGTVPGDYGLTSALLITPTIQVTTPGTYTLQGTLTDATGEVVGTAGATAALSVGTTSDLALNFDGQAIGATGKDGPYHLRDLTLTEDASGTVLTDDSVPQAYTTATYTASQFARPLVQILPGTQDQGVGPGAQGRFHQLTVSFTATGALSDTYQVAATLSSAQGQAITTVTRTVALSATPARVDLPFSGADIAANGTDGPYAVTGVTLVPQSSPTTYVSYPSFWTTQAYSATNFGPLPSPSQSATATNAPSMTVTSSPTSMPTATATSRYTPTPTATSTPTPTGINTPMATATAATHLPTGTGTATTPVMTSTNTPTATATATATGTATGTATPSATSTSTPTGTATVTAVPTGASQPRATPIPPSPTTGPLPPTPTTPANTAIQGSAATATATSGVGQPATVPTPTASADSFVPVGPTDTPQPRTRATGKPSPTPGHKQTGTSGPVIDNVRVPGGIVTENSAMTVSGRARPSIPVDIVAGLTTTTFVNQKTVVYVRPGAIGSGTRPHTPADAKRQPACRKGVRGCVAKTVVRRVARTTQLYHTTARTRAGRKGRFTATVRLRYRTRKTLQAMLTVTVRTSQGQSSRRMRIKVVPPATHRSASKG